MEKLFFIVISFLIASTYACTFYGYGVNQQDRDFIVNKHNAVRKQIANKQIADQPRGINLKAMRWDNALAQSAQNIANSCKFEHQKVRDGRWFAVGQNLYLSKNSQYDKRTDWNGAIQGWFNEHTIYHYPGGFSKATGHYTQVVWADTNFVGCGYSFYKENPNDRMYQKFYVCNYGPAGNVNNMPPYKTGSSGCENLC